jgi:hypothetical protein
MLTANNITTHNHEQLAEDVANIVTEFREILLIPPRWKFDIQILCEEQMALAYNLKADEEPPQASMWWEYIPNARYRLRIRCDLHSKSLRWIVAHEMLEAILSRYGNFTQGLVNAQHGKGKKSALEENHREIRDEIIEWWLAILIPDERPDFGGVPAGS